MDSRRAIVVGSGVSDVGVADSVRAAEETPIRRLGWPPERVTMADAGTVEVLTESMAVDAAGAYLAVESGHIDVRAMRKILDLTGDAAPSPAQ